jgi:hypothetical protein
MTGKIRIGCGVLAVSLCAWSLGPGRSALAGEADREAVRRAALAYVEAFYEVDPGKIDRHVHPEVSNIGFVPAPEGGGYREVRMGFADIKKNAATANKDGVFPKGAVKEVVVFDVLNQTASVKVLAAWGIDRKSTRLNSSHNR